jgi:hypothetical protein
MNIPLRRTNISAQTRKNWLSDAAVFVGGLLAALSGIYFLFMPSGGYQGGRNPMYGVTILFSRHTWSDLHTWTGVLMLVAAAVHLAIHWQWVKMMSKRVVHALSSKGSKLSKGARLNVAIDLVVAISFLLCAVSGIYFLFLPEGGHNANLAPTFLFSRTAWDLIHTWSGVVVTMAVAVHLAIHWRWVKHVTVRFFSSLVPQRAAQAAKVGSSRLERPLA